jgi:hypothetical protein
MNTYKIELVIVSDTPPDWIVPAIKDQLEAGERVAYFDYKIEKHTKMTERELLNLWNT